MKTVLQILNEKITAYNNKVSHVYAFKLNHAEEKMFAEAFEEYQNQFKVEPGLSLQQCKEQIAKTYSYLDANMTKIKYESWDAFIGGASIQDTEDAIDEILELHTASLTSEIKGLRDMVQLFIDSSASSDMNLFYDNLEKAKKLLTIK